MDDEQPSEALDGIRRCHEINAEAPGCAKDIARQPQGLADGLENELSVGLHDHGEVLQKAEETIGQRDFVCAAVVVLWRAV